jgi:hypothetical protein
LRALVAQLKLILVVGGLGRPHESTKPRRRGRSRRERGRAGCRVGWSGLASVRAERKRECESAKTDESLLAPSAFLRRSCVAAEQQHQHQHQHQQKASGRPIPRYLPERVLVCVLHASPLLDLMLTPLCFRDHTDAQRIGLSRNFLLTRRA